MGFHPFADLSYENVHWLTKTGESKYFAASLQTYTLDNIL